MPKLLYFGMQGRAQMIRYAAAAGGIDFEDVHLTREQWMEAKTAETYGAGNQLPLWIEDDGKIRNQSVAILHHVAFMGGFVPKSADEAYDMQWIFDADADYAKKDGSMKALFADEADEETVNKTYECIVELMDKLNDKMSDGRKHAAGENVTAADFRVLTMSTGIVNNQNLKSAALGERLREAYASREHLKRVVDNGMQLQGVADVAGKFNTFL